MDKQILAALVGRDESKPLLLVKPLHFSSFHVCYSLDPTGRVQAPSGIVYRGYPSREESLLLINHTILYAPNGLLLHRLVEKTENPIPSSAGGGLERTARPSVKYTAKAIGGVARLHEGARARACDARYDRGIWHDTEGGSPRRACGWEQPIDLRDSGTPLVQLPMEDGRAEGRRSFRWNYAAGTIRACPRRWTRSWLRSAISKGRTRWRPSFARRERHETVCRDIVGSVGLGLTGLG
jgi:hypothetical protein